tara:strand:+ start:990 stop:1283 length:294 start_codon:yes stop_codon:yes gene_type:complete
MSDRKLSFIEKWTMSVNEMSADILTWGDGVRVVDIKKSYWQEVKYKVYLMGAMLLLGIIFLLFGWLNMSRIVAFFIIIQLFMIGLPGVKRIWEKLSS